MDLRNPRKYRCFVCGEDFYEYNEFTLHILEEHEEGREYIVCPKLSCGAPVRDLRSHFKACHRHDEMPKGVQTKVTIWKDTSGKHTKKPQHRKGDFVSAKNGGRLIHYRSGWECKCYELLEEWDDVIAYAAEPIKIPYMWKGTQHNYKPDIIIQFSDTRKELWEIKPANQKKLQQNKAKWAAAKEYCLARDWKFQVITEEGLARLNILLKEQNI